MIVFIRRIFRYAFVLLFLLVFHVKMSGQEQHVQNDTVNHQRLNAVIYTGAGLYTATIGVLYFAWYKDSDLTGFHWFNDNSAWLQVDKVGHATTAYIMTNYAFWSLQWAGVDNKRAAIYGGIMGFSAMTAIEVLDGFSSDWGASPGDLIANTAGSLLFTSQQLLWDEQRIRPKFSYHPTQYAQYRPDLLGVNGLQRILKDYNGQTYWLSANIKSFIRKDSRFPGWVNMAVGYGAKGMIGANSNPSVYNGKQLPSYNRVRQVYLSMDVDWTRIKTRSHLMKFIFKSLNFIKLPFPTLEYNNENGAVFYWLYF